MSKSSPTASSSSTSWSPTDSHHETACGTELTQLSPCSPVKLAGGQFERNNDQHPPSFTLKTPLLPAGPHSLSTQSIVNGGVSDPFHWKHSTTTQSSIGTLSPTAATFRPLACAPVIRRSDTATFSTEQLANQIAHSSSCQLKALPHNTTIEGRFSAEHHTDPALPTGSTYKRSVPSLPSKELRESRGDGAQNGVYEYALEQDQVTRFLRLSKLSRETDIRQLNSCFTDPSFNLPLLAVVSQLQARGVVYVYFSDIRDSRAAFVKIGAMHPEWSLAFVDEGTFAATLEVDPKHEFESRVLVAVTCHGSQYSSEAEAILTMIFNFLSSFGDFHGWKIVEARYPVLTVRVDYYDSEVAKCVGEMQEVRLAGIVLRLHRGIAIDYETENKISRSSFGREGDMLAMFRAARISEKPQARSLTIDTSPGRTTSANQGRSLVGISSGSNNERRRMDAGVFPSTRSSHHLNQTAASRDLQLQRYSYPATSCTSPTSTRGYNSSLQRRSSESMSMHHNAVDISRISSGVDVRTTIMLRNIPNKITQAMLKEIVDETSRGKYDFMYLRIDFANNCNVGYAFINFEDPWHIVDFVKARAGWRWNCFSSDKVAEVSYATIQGKDCLVQKFRNSSVMMEHPSFRPKIFKTGDRPDAGQELDFPEPDNTFKMRRSVENAEHVGLFAPRSSQHLRDDHRHRYSQYDRGTRHAQLEYTAFPEYGLS